MTRSAVWTAWLAANVIPSVAASTAVLAMRDSYGVDGAVVTAYVLLFGLTASLQAVVRARWVRCYSQTAPKRAGRWTTWTLIALIVAMFFGVAIVATLDGLGHERLGLIAGWAVAGTVLGVAQAILLETGRAWKWSWIAASVAGWSIAAAGHSWFARVASGFTQLAVVRWLAGGLHVEGNIELGITALTFALYGMLTGAVLAYATPRPAVR